MLLLFEFFSLFRNMIFLFRGQGKIALIYDFEMTIILLFIVKIHHMVNLYMPIHIITEHPSKLK